MCSLSGRFVIALGCGAFTFCVRLLFTGKGGNAEIRPTGILYGGPGLWWRSTSFNDSKQGCGSCRHSRPDPWLV
uniref:Uncharacterized protein n=1 Tax=Aegilops tauschii subsp. strangulata TaxID=200361 RepID=A0A453J2K9_AEGTS